MIRSLLTCTLQILKNLRSCVDMEAVSIILSTLLVVSIAVNILFVRRKKRISKPYTSDCTVVGDWADLATGSSGDMEIEQGFLRVLQEMYALFCRKHHDYGRNNISVGGLHGVTIRLGDKTSRLFNLMGISDGAHTGGGSAPAVKGEALEDSFLDMGNYGPIGVMLARGWWPRVRPEDVWQLEEGTAECQ
jgi:hypothetical protein